MRVAGHRPAATNTNCQGFSPIEDEYRLAMLEAEHAWVSGILDDLASGELYWDRDTDPATGRRVCSIGWGRSPALPRPASTDDDLPP